jgi:hypothetical protein
VLLSTDIHIFAVITSICVSLSNRFSIISIAARDFVVRAALCVASAVIWTGVLDIV